MRHEVGLHARPSVKLTKLAKAFEFEDRSWAFAGRPLDRRQEHRQGHGDQGAEGLDHLFSCRGQRREGGAGRAGDAGRRRFPGWTIGRIAPRIASRGDLPLRASRCGPLVRLAAAKHEARRSRSGADEQQALVDALEASKLDLAVLAGKVDDEDAEAILVVPDRAARRRESRSAGVRADRRWRGRRPRLGCSDRSGDRGL